MADPTLTLAEDAIVSLAALAAAIDRGELTATPTESAYIAGALAALRALTTTEGCT